MGPPESKKPRRSIMVKFSVNNDILDSTDKSLNDGDAKDPNGELNGDTVFDPCAEMMIHDYDDERTLDEEEALENNEDTQTELSDLQKEGDMPLSELLAMYGYGDQDNSGSEEADEESIVNEPEAKDTTADDVEAEEVEEPSQLAQLYPEIPTANDSGGGTSRYLRSGSRPQSEEEEDDCDYSPDEEDWKKTIMVGSDYQAKIPIGLFKYDDALPYENDDKMLWDPSSLSESETVSFLASLQDSANLQAKDDEQALYLLLQCGYNVDEALRRRRINCVPPTDTMSIWSEEECRNFETGMRLYGKDFHTIQKTKVRTRSVGELVQFYYLWKKTERHDVYAHKSRLEKKKYSLHPGITDYMDRFLEEQDVGSAPPNVHLLMYSDSKKNRDTAGDALKANSAEVLAKPAPAADDSQKPTANPEHTTADNT